MLRARLMIERDQDGIAHIVALSGGKDSTAMALRLRETMDVDIPLNYVCTPTGDELPPMLDHWARLVELLGQPIIPLNTKSFRQMCEHEKALPNWRMRFCTKLLKIQPFKRFLVSQVPCISYVGLRADETDRDGANYGSDHHGGSVVLSTEGAFVQEYPLRDWGWGLAEVKSYLDQCGVVIPERTDCARCFYQTLGEWWLLWKQYPEIFKDAELQEIEMGATFRSPQRDSWPADLASMRRKFESGEVPRNTKQQLDLFRQSMCRACTL